MNTTPEALGRMSAQDYLDFEEEQVQERHELVDGWLYAMTGGTVQHERVAGNLFAALLTHLAGGPCRPYESDLKLRIGEDFYYPDIMVRCHDASLGRKWTYIDDADVVIEVLSPSTQRYDRGDERRVCWNVPSLKHYVLVSQDEPFVEHHTSRDGEPERLEGPGAVLRLESLGLEMSLGALYR